MSYKISKFSKNIYILLSLFLLFFSGCSADKKNSNKPQRAWSMFKPYLHVRTYFPTKKWQQVKAEKVGIEQKLLKKAVDYAFQRTGNEQDRKGIRTDGLVIIKNGFLILEKYARGYNANKRHLTWSTSKSFVNALYGIAILKKYLKVDDLAYKYYPILKDKEHSKITIRHLLQMRSGLYWNEGYEASPLESSVLAMLYTWGRKDMGKFTASQKMQYKEGTHWYYSSGTTNLLVDLMGNILKKERKETVETFIWRELFDKIGMKDVTWERDGKGTIIGSSYLYARPKDLAKFGFLYLNNGMWNKEQILPKNWVKFTTTASPAEQKGVYGAHWWLNAGRPEIKRPQRWPDVPADCFSTSGHWGQYIFVIPSLDLVVVRVGDDRDHSFKPNTLLKKIIASITNKKIEAIKQTSKTDLSKTKKTSKD